MDPTFRRAAGLLAVVLWSIWWLFGAQPVQQLTLPFATDEVLGGHLSPVFLPLATRVPTEESIPPTEQAAEQTTKKPAEKTTEKPTEKQAAQEVTKKTVVPKFSANQKKAFAYKGKHYLSLVSLRGDYVFEHLEAGRNIIYTDCDVVWKRDPREHFEGCHDAYMSSDGKNREGTYFCTGFMAFRPTEASKQLVTAWSEKLKEKSGLNQPIFNKILRKQKGYDFVPLSRKLFPNGADFFSKKSTMKAEDRKNVVTVHNNFIIGSDQKRSRFKEHGLWLVGEAEAEPARETKNLYKTVPEGTQLGPEQIEAILGANNNGNFLVFGLGNDSPFWHYSTTGKVFNAFAHCCSYLVIPSR
jgi:hypothetical protein